MHAKILTFLLMGVAATAHPDFINGDFEQDISVGWTVEGHAERIISDPSNPYGRVSANPFVAQRSHMYQVASPTDRLHYLTYSYFTIHDGYAGAGSALVTQSGGYLAPVSRGISDGTGRVSFPNPGYQRSGSVRRDLMQWATDYGLPPDDTLYVRVGISANLWYVGGPFVYYNDSYANLYDVRFEPYPTDVVNGDFENLYDGWEVSGPGFSNRFDGDDDPDMEMILYNDRTYWTNDPRTTAVQRIRINNPYQVLRFSARAFHSSMTEETEVTAVIVRLLDRNGSLVGEERVMSEPSDNGWRDYSFPIVNGLFPLGAPLAPPLALTINILADRPHDEVRSTVMMDDVRLEQAHHDDVWVLR